MSKIAAVIFLFDSICCVTWGLGVPKERCRLYRQRSRHQNGSQLRQRSRAPERKPAPPPRQIVKIALVSGYNGDCFLRLEDDPETGYFMKWTITEGETSGMPFYVCGQFPDGGQTIVKPYGPWPRRKHRH